MNKRTPLLGAHMSIAGGFDKSVQRARQATCDCVQIFTKNNNQWRAKKLGEDEAATQAGGYLRGAAHNHEDAYGPSDYEPQQ